MSLIQELLEYKKELAIEDGKNRRSFRIKMIILSWLV